MVHLLSIFSVDFHLIFLTIHTRLHEPHAPNSKIKKSKTNVEYINKHCQFLNGPKNRVLELNCTWNDWLTWTSSWRCYWRKARTPRLRLVLYVQLQLSQCSGGLLLRVSLQLPQCNVADILQSTSVSTCLSSFVYFQYNGNKIKRDNLCTICVFPPKVIKRRWSCGWLGGRVAAPLGSQSVTPICVPPTRSHLLAHPHLLNWYIIHPPLLPSRPKFYIATNNNEEIGPKIKFGHNFWLEGPIDTRSTRLNCILQDLFRDTPLGHSWRAQICAKNAYLAYLGAYLSEPNMVKWGVPEKILQNAVQTRWSLKH